MIRKYISHVSTYIRLGISIICIFLVYIIDNLYFTNFKLILPAFTTFLGAVLAFRLNSLKDEREDLRKKRLALNLALFVLVRQFNAIKNILNQIEPLRNNSIRAFNLPAIKPPEYKSLTQNFNDLAFLLELDIDEINLLLKLTITQEIFDITITALSLRNVLYIDEVQTAISEKNLNLKEFKECELETILGKRIFHGAIQGVNQIYDHVDHSAREIPLILKSVHFTAKKLFPKEKFFQIEFLPEEKSD
jgi:hypothetical protein